MSQKPFDFERALTGLRSATPPLIPSPEQILKRKHRRFPYRASAIGLAAALAVAIFRPRSGTNLAWAQVVQSTERAQSIHVQNFRRDGKKALEWWIDGKQYAFLFYNPDRKGGIFEETRCDGQYMVQVSHSRAPRNGSTKMGKKQRVEGRQGMTLGALVGTTSNVVDDIIRNKEYKLLDERTVETSDGPRTRYRLNRTSRFTINGNPRTVQTNALVFVDPKSHLIREVQYVDGHDNLASKVTIDYPSQIDESVFKMNRPDLLILDVDADRRVVAETIRRGLGSQSARNQKVTLRAVLFDKVGALWVLWSGNLPHGTLPHLVRVVGQPTPKVVPNLSYPTPDHKHTVNAFSLKGFTANATQANQRTKVLPSINARLGGMALGLMYKNLPKLDLVVPVLDATGKRKLGEATFRNVPVHRIDSIYDYAVELGLR